MKRLLLALPLALWAASESGAVLPVVGTPTSIMGGMPGMPSFPPAVAFNATNQEYLVVWEKYYTGPADWDIWAARYDANGNQIEAPYWLEYQTTTARAPQVAYAPPENRYLIVWAETNSSGSSSIRGRILLGGSSNYTTSIGFVIGSGNGPFSQPAIAYGGGKWLVVWQEGGSNADIRGQFLTADGSLLGSTSTIYSDSGDSRHPTVSAIGENFLVAWSQRTGSGAPGKILARTFWSSGGSGTIVYTYSNSSLDCDWPRTAANSTNEEHLVVWHTSSSSDDSAQQPAELHRRRVSQYADPLSGPETVLPPYGSVHSPTVTWNPSVNRYLVVFGIGDIQGILAHVLPGGSDTPLETNTSIAASPGWIPAVASSTTSSRAWIAYFAIGPSPYQLWGQLFDFDTPPPPNNSANTPGNLGQFNGSTPISVGGSIPDNAVVFKGTVSDPDGNNVKLQIELKPTTQPFDGSSGILESSTVSSGSTVSINTNNLSGSYHWRARAVDANGAASNWTSFGGNSDSSPDFAIETEQPPNAPSNLAQLKQDGATAIALGGSTTESTIVFQATVTDPNAGDSLLLEVEVKMTMEPFDGTGLQQGTPVANGSVAGVTVSNLPPSSYHWRARAVDGQGLAGPWVSFGGNLEAEADFIAVSIAVPGAPAGLGQFQSDGATSIAVGTAVSPATILMKGTVTGPNGGTLKLQVEVKAVGTLFDGSGLVESAWVDSGTTASVALSGLAENSYHWRARAIDPQGSVGPWASFGNNAETEPDFAIASNSPPSGPTSLGQFKSNESTAIPTGGTTNEASFVVKGIVTDPDAGQVLKLQIQSFPVGIAFDAASNLFVSAAVPSGSTASVSLPSLAAGAYHWRARTMDETGATSAWVSFGGNSDPGDTDVTLAPPLSNHSPGIPFSLDQRRVDALSPIAVGATTNEQSVTFYAKVTDPDGDDVKLVVELKPLGIPFSGTFLIESSFVTDGSEAFVLSPGLPNLSYTWRARAIDPQGVASEWVVSPVNSATGASFVVSTVGNAVPSNPQSASQLLWDGSATISVGSPVTQTTVLLRAKLSDPDSGQSVKLQVEVRLVGQSFTGAPTGESAFVQSTSTASVAVGNLAAGAYRWRCRASDSAGTFSAWLDFGGNVDGDVDFAIAPTSNQPPTAPSNLGQFKTDGATAILPGGGTNESTLLFHAVVGDPDSDSVKLQVEVQPSGATFSGTASFETGFLSAGIATLAASGFSDGSYRWQARTADATGAVSPWVPFQVSASVDFAVSTLTNGIPAAPIGLVQSKTVGTAIPWGGTTHEDLIAFKALVSDPDLGGLLRLQVELRPLTEPLTGNPTATSLPYANGSTATLFHWDLIVGASYHWQARVLDSNGVASGWVAFGANPEADFKKVANQPPGVPTDLEQVLTIEPGGTFAGKISDPDGDPARLQVELRPLGWAFTSAAMTTSLAVASGTSASATIAPLESGQAYHWQARAIDTSGAASPWVSFGTNDETDPDFTTSLPSVVAESTDSLVDSSSGGCLGRLPVRGTGNLAWVVGILLVVLGAMARRR